MSLLMDISSVLDWALQRKLYRIIDGCLDELDGIKKEPVGIFVERFDFNTFRLIASKSEEVRQTPEDVVTWFEELLLSFKALETKYSGAIEEVPLNKWESILLAIITQVALEFMRVGEGSLSACAADMTQRLDLVMKGFHDVYGDVHIDQLESIILKISNPNRTVSSKKLKAEIKSNPCSHFSDLVAAFLDDLEQLALPSSTALSVTYDRVFPHKDRLSFDIMQQLAWTEGDRTAHGPYSRHSGGGGSSSSESAAMLTVPSPPARAIAASSSSASSNHSQPQQQQQPRSAVKATPATSAVPNSVQKVSKQFSDKYDAIDPLKEALGAGNQAVRKGSESAPTPAPAPALTAPPSKKRKLAEEAKVASTQFTRRSTRHSADIAASEIEKAAPKAATSSRRQTRTSKKVVAQSDATSPSSSSAEEETVASEADEIEDFTQPQGPQTSAIRATITTARTPSSAGSLQPRVDTARRQSADAGMRESARVARGLGAAGNGTRVEFTDDEDEAETSSRKLTAVQKLTQLKKSDKAIPKFKSLDESDLTIGEQRFKRGRGRVFVGGSTKGSGAQRSKWTFEEDEAFLGAIDKYGAGNWAEMLSDTYFGEILKRRNNIHLKDKYRTLQKQGRV